MEMLKLVLQNVLSTVHAAVPVGMVNVIAATLGTILILFKELHAVFARTIAKLAHQPLIVSLVPMDIIWIAPTNVNNVLLVVLRAQLQDYRLAQHAKLHKAITQQQQPLITLFVPNHLYNMRSSAQAHPRAPAWMDFTGMAHNVKVVQQDARLVMELG